ncbi:MAG: glycosyltransferase [Crocinitomicaceae bacterium]|nr:glycosyltransferase [Crocinitomicaceae bacterium]
MDVSIVIVNYNVEHFLSQCLLSVRASVRDLELKGHEAEVWVVDNRSVDGSCAMVREQFPEVHLLALDENLGFSKGNNRAIEQCNGRWVLLLNPDTVIPENALSKCLAYAESSPDLGGMGVPMVDGMGRFLPESKRGMPTPWVAFCKISGLYKLAPKTEKLNQYYMGHLDPDENHCIEILSGAFMWMRKEALDQVGLLDEAYFMYGEDIDLSWRLLKGGWKNHYFAETSIIHYKGESTKKGSLNYVLVFYKAMQIFARTHFSGGNARAMLGLIQLAIYFRASLAILARVIRMVKLPVLEFSLFWTALVVFLMQYGEAKEIQYDWNWALPATAAYAALWLLALKFQGGYDRPWKLISVARGVLMGGLFLLAGYGLLPENMRFSRAILVFGALALPLIVLAVRWRWDKGRGWNGKGQKRRLFISSPAELNAISDLIAELEPHAELRAEKIQALHPGSRDASANESSSEDVSFLGGLTDLNEVIRINRINEVILSGRELTASQKISAMTGVADANIHFRIAWTEGGNVVGVGGPELGSISDWPRAIQLPRAKRIKRTFDIFVAFLVLVLSPFFAAFGRTNWIPSAIDVLLGKRTWVGIPADFAKESKLQKYVFSRTHTGSNRARHRTLLAYVRDYRWTVDLGVIREALISHRAIHRHGNN